MGDQHPHAVPLLGVAVDGFGNIAYDPSKNVIALVEANAKAAEALRVSDIKFSDAQAAHLTEIGALRAANAETLRISDLDRLAKTREVDVLAGSASAAALATAVQTLANTSDRNAETLRNLVNSTAATMAKQTADQAGVLSAQTDSLVKDINARIAELQKASYQGFGKSSVADPMMADFMIEMKKMSSGIVERAGRESVSDPVQTKALENIQQLLLAQSTTTGKGQGVHAVWVVVLGVASLLGFGLAALVAIVTLVMFLNRAPGTPPYQPAPAGTMVPVPPQTGGRMP